ncbi:hypothetical protein O181_007367 [Austropuccinia psidii MF-1]|uniref:Uncharacterized protein n=1 Tax=Austropuccinia psidii MF-1 TaxID=1389203 RepID=A0A9Q3GIE5_9BASI|nr:hypothetical protein [Austropuccinia psidii MF-1]
MPCKHQDASRCHAIRRSAPRSLEVASTSHLGLPISSKDEKTQRSGWIDPTPVSARYQASRFGNWNLERRQALISRISDLDIEKLDSLRSRLVNSLQSLTSRSEQWSWLVQAQGSTCSSPSQYRSGLEYIQYLLRELAIANLYLKSDRRLAEQETTKLQTASVKAAIAELPSRASQSDSDMTNRCSAMVRKWALESTGSSTERFLRSSVAQPEWLVPSSSSLRLAIQQALQHRRSTLTKTALRLRESECWSSIDGPASPMECLLSRPSHAQCKPAGRSTLPCSQAPSLGRWLAVARAAGPRRRDDRHRISRLHNVSELASN